MQDPSLREKAVPGKRADLLLWEQLRWCRAFELQSGWSSDVQAPAAVVGHMGSVTKAI